MLNRLGIDSIKDFLSSDQDCPLLVEGMRHVGKTFAVTTICRDLKKTLMHLDLRHQPTRDALRGIRSCQSLEALLAARFGRSVGTLCNAVLFFDNIHLLPELLARLEAFAEDLSDYTFVASATSFDVITRKTGSDLPESTRVRLLPLCFNEFLKADNWGFDFLQLLPGCLTNGENVPVEVHLHLMDLYRRFLIVGGMPAVVADYRKNRDLDAARRLQRQIISDIRQDLAFQDASKGLCIQSLYRLLPEFLRCERKRVFFSAISDKKEGRARAYRREVDYLVGNGLANPAWQLRDLRDYSTNPIRGCLLKLFPSDVGLLSRMLYGEAWEPILNDEKDMRMEALHECAVANSLSRSGHPLYYYESRGKGAIDLLFDWKFGRLAFQLKAGKHSRPDSAIPTLFADPDTTAVILADDPTISIQPRPIGRLPVYMADIWSAPMFPDS